MRRNRCLSLLFVIASIVLFGFAFANSLTISSVKESDRKDQSEDQIVKILLNALSGYSMPFATDIQVVDSGKKGACPEGYEHLFQKVWLGIKNGWCLHNQQVIS